MPFGTAISMVLLIARHNLSQQVAADLYGLSQPTVSRTWRYLLALIGQVTAMDSKHLAQALQAGVVLIDGTPIPTGNRAGTGTTSFNGKHRKQALNIQVNDKGNLLTVTDGKGIATATAGDYTTSYTYDTYGQLLTAKDANENVTKYRGYTDVGYPEVTEDALGNVSRTMYSNDGRGLVTQVEDPLDGLVTQAYDAFGRPLAGTQRKSADETITTPAPVYDANDNVTVSTAPNGAVSTATYDKADQVTKSTMPKDTSTGPERASVFTYDTVGNLETVTEPKGVATTANASDFVTRYGYDSIYQQTSVTNADGDVISYSYDEVGNLVKTVDPKKNASADPDDFTSTTKYDLNHRPISATDAAGNTSSTDYDADGLAVSSTDPDGNTSYVTYDVRGAQVETKTPHESVGGVVQYRTTKVEYDEVGNTTRVITPRGVATADPDDFASRTEYDALNRPVKQFQPYDPADTRHNDANVFTETTYDAAGRVVKTSMPPSEGQTVRNDSTTEYFDNGWIKKSSDAWDISTTYEYDDLGAQTARTLTSADGSANRTMTWSYFPDGKLRTKADDGVPVGSHSVVTDNDTEGLVEPTGTWATASAAGEQGTNHRTHAAVSGASTDKFAWTLDVPADGTYSVAVTYPQVSGAASDAKFELTHGKAGDGHGGEVTEPAYTVNQTTGAGAWKDMGRVALRKGDPVTLTLKPSATGKVVADAVRLVRDNSADTDTEAHAFAYSYDVNGNMTGINDTSSGARADDYQVAYTGLNQVASVKEALAGQETATTSYSYDVLGQPLTVAHPDQSSAYKYEDPRHLLTSVAVDDLNDSAAAKVTRYSYDHRGMRATETKANGNVVTNGYFLDGALKSLREEKSGGALVASHAYTYDNNGNKHTDVASKANADVAGAYLNSTTTYSYDPVDRLSKSVKTGNGAKTETYEHDDNANVISQDVGGEATTYSYDRNRLLTATTGTASASYRYDPFGRQTSVVSAGLTISRTTYDGFDHIAQSEKMNDAGVLESTTYKYDPLDRTASKTADGKTTDYTYLGLSSEVLGEEVAGQLTKSYQYSPWGQRLSQITHQADPEAGIEAGESTYYGYNAHTDVETSTDDSGNTVATYGYTAYGNADESEYTGIDGPETGSPEDVEPYNAYRYNSKRWDAGTGTYDMGFRDYAPDLNRFTTRDMYNGAFADMGLSSDPYTGNRYAFTAGNPISRIELDGHIYEECSQTADYTCTVSAGGNISAQVTEEHSLEVQIELYVDLGASSEDAGESYGYALHANALRDALYDLESSNRNDRMAESAAIRDRVSWESSLSFQAGIDMCVIVCFNYKVGWNFGSGKGYTYVGYGAGFEVSAGASVGLAGGVTPGATEELDASGAAGPAALAGSLVMPLDGHELGFNRPMADVSGGSIAWSPGIGGGGHYERGFAGEGGNFIEPWAWVYDDAKAQLARYGM
jgi:RHS repeat-associated protein